MQNTLNPRLPDKQRLFNTIRPSVLHHGSQPKRFTTALITSSLLWLSLPASAAPPEPPPGAPPSLQHTKIPPVKNLSQFVADEKMAVLLGKALFWDTQAGSDGQACASCHFHAGADNRTKNQISPGLNMADGPDHTFQPTASGGKGGPNYTLVKEDFPLHQLSDPDDRHSRVLSTTNDTVSSQGTFGGTFIGIPASIDEDEDEDECARFADPHFNVSGHGVRKVELRNTPSVINAVFNFRNFWDGRANNVFNGVDPFGKRSQARVFDQDGKPVKVDLRNAALASQAVGPPASDLEMICSGRQFAAMGKKLLGRRALKRQMVAADDSVLGSHRRDDGKGLEEKYEELIEKAFKSKWWASDSDFHGYSQMEANFTLFWGIALQLYQSTLVSDQAPYDKFARNFSSPFDPERGDKSALTDAQFRGLKLFLDKGKCISCHNGPEFSGAASDLQAENQENGLVERMLMGDGRVALYDNGFYNIGVTPTRHDLGVGGRDPFGNPLSFTEQFVYQSFVNPVDPVQFDPCTFEVPFDSHNCSHIPSDLRQERRAVAGAFKTPILRNVALTGPYMHNGGIGTLEQIVDFYNRGGNFNNREKDPDIQRLNLSESEKSDLVAFMEALTDPRVANEQAPFDHPSMLVANGHPGDEWNTFSADGVLSDDDVIEIPAVGAHGRSAKGLSKLEPFMSESTMGVNLALKAPVTQSSTAYGGRATFAVDGKAGGTSVTHTAYEAQPWLQVDLGKQYDLDKIVLWNRRNCCMDRLKDFVVFVSDRDMSHLSLKTAMNDSNIWHYEMSGAAGQTVTIPAKVTGRYVRVRLKGSGFLSLEELQVFSRP